MDEQWISDAWAHFANHANFPINEDVEDSFFAALQETTRPHKSKAQIGTGYTPTLVGKLAESAGRDLLPEWQRAKAEAYHSGRRYAEKHLLGIIEDNHTHEYRDNPYLEYECLLGIAQAIANHGRDLVGVENIAAKVADTEGKNR